MACTLTVPFWPTSYDNLQWSRDNQLAVLGGEHILFITPRLKEVSPSRVWWDTENVRINAFTESEVSRSAVLTDRDCSIGEETSIFQAYAAAWSGSGLARYGGSALAVLTSNHVLSLWAPESVGKRTPVWHRILVVNHAIRKFYREQSDALGDEREPEEVLQIQQRVRSFAWTQPVYHDLERPHAELFSGRHYLVVATEGGHILIVQVSSPYGSLRNKQSTWQATVTGSLLIKDATQPDGGKSASGSQLPLSTIAMPAAASPDFIGADHIAVGQWIFDELPRGSDGRSLSTRPSLEILNNKTTPKRTNGDLNARVDKEYVDAHPNEIFHHRGQGTWARGLPPPGSSVRTAVRGPKAKELFDAMQRGEQVDVMQSGEQVDENVGSRATHAAALIFLLKGRLYSTVIHHDSKRDVEFACGSRPAVSRHLDDRADLIGPLKVHPGEGAGALVLFGTDAVFHGHLRFDENKKALTANFQHHHLDDRWDDASGATVTCSENGHTILHVVSQLSTSSAPTHTLRLPLGLDHDVVDQPAWHFALGNSKAAFGATNDLGDHVQDRTWGITCSPVGGYTATCVSMHPNDVLAYIISAEQTSVLNMTPEFDVSTNPFELREGSLNTHGGLPTSTLIFYLMRYLERRADAETPMANDFNTLVTGVQNMLSNSSEHDLDSTKAESSDTTDILLCKTRISIFVDKEIRHAQANRICDLANSSTVLRPDSTTTIVRQIAGVVFSLSDNIVELNELSMDIRKMHDIALSRLDTNYNLGDGEPSAKTWSEQCKICHQSIAFESFKWARCQRGHQFGRCALSLLAIQEPGTTKDCSVCGLHYLDETTVGGFEPVSQDSRMANGLDGVIEIDQNGSADDERQKITMASLLFDACNVCLYCGGNFKG